MNTFCHFQFCNCRRNGLRWLKKPATIINLYLDNRTAKETTKVFTLNTRNTTAWHGKEKTQTVPNIWHKSAFQHLQVKYTWSTQIHSTAVSHCNIEQNMRFRPVGSTENFKLGVKSGVFLQRQKQIVSYCVKKFVVIMIKREFKCQFFRNICVFITEILWRIFWLNNWQSVFNVVKRLR